MKQRTAEMCRFQISSWVLTIVYTQFQTFECTDSAGSHCCQALLCGQFYIDSKSYSSKYDTFVHFKMMGGWLVNRIFFWYLCYSFRYYLSQMVELSTVELYRSKPLGSIHGSAQSTSLFAIELGTISIALANNWRVLIHQHMLSMIHLFAWWQVILLRNRLSWLLNFIRTLYVPTSRTN